METSIDPTDSPEIVRSSGGDGKHPLDDPEFVSDLSEIKVSPANKKLRSGELTDELPVPQHHGLGVDHESTFEDHHNTDISSAIGKEGGLNQGSSSAIGINSLDSANAISFSVPTMPAIGATQGTMAPPGGMTYPFLPNPIFGFQGQPSGQPNTSQLSPQYFQSQPIPLSNFPFGNFPQGFDVGTGGELDNQAGGTEQALPQDQNNQINPCFQSQNDSQIGGGGMGDFSTHLVNQPGGMHLQLPQRQQNQQPSPVALPRKASQNNIPMPMNNFQLPQMFPSQLPVQPVPGISENVSAAFAARQRLLFSNTPMQAMMPPVTPGGMGNVQRGYFERAMSRPKGIPLALSCDEEQLSDYQILVRRQLELFEATQEDVGSNTQGRKKQVSPGQVGIRCRFCAGFPLRQRGRGAVYYPAKLEGVYQASQNMASSHLCESCQSIPMPLKQELRILRERRDTASGGKQYWADGARAIGLYETDIGLKLKRKGASAGSPR